MEELIGKFSAQLGEAVEIGERASAAFGGARPSNVIIAGLGGSGIGGTIVSELVSGQAAIPIAVSKGYSLPSYVNADTLVITCSYSGNTEETLATFEDARQKGARIACITSGGKLLELAQEYGAAHVVIPGGMPPRACLSYSLIQLLYILHGYGVIDDSFKKQIADAISLLDSEEENIRTEARGYAARLVGKTPIVYAPFGHEGIAIRFKQQLNENAKTHAWWGVIPEMNHNEMIAWDQPNNSIGVVIFRNKDDYDRVAKRIEICKEMIAKCTDTIIEIWSKGNSPLEETLYQIHFGDWVSLDLAELKKADPMEIKNIDFLKGKMAEE